MMTKPENIPRPTYTHKQDEWDRFLATLGTIDYSIFKLNRNILKKTPATHPQIDPNGTIYSDIEKAELLSDMFQQQFTPNQVRRSQR